MSRVTFRKEKIENRGR